MDVTDRSVHMDDLLIRGAQIIDGSGCGWLYR